MWELQRSTVSSCWEENKNTGWQRSSMFYFFESDDVAYYSYSQYSAVLHWCRMLQHLNHRRKGMKRDSFFTKSAEEREVYYEVKMFLHKSPLIAYCWVQNWEHIKPIWTQSFWHRTHCAVVPWICDKVTHTHPQRQRDKDREGQKVFSSLNLGVIIGWGGRRNFPCCKPSSNLAAVSNSSFLHQS